MKFTKLIIFAFIFLGEALSVYCQSDSTLRYLTQTEETRSKISPQDALEMLKEGNKRFVNGFRLQRDISGRRGNGEGKRL